MVFVQYNLKLQYGNVVIMAVAGQRANKCHFTSYIMFCSQKVFVYNISAVEKEGLFAYCDLMSFEFYYNRLLSLIMASFFSCTDIILKVM